MAQTFRQRIAHAEAMARADMLRFQPEVINKNCNPDLSKICVDQSLINQHIYIQSGLTLSSEGMLGPLTSDLPADGMDLSDIPPAED